MYQDILLTVCPLQLGIWRSRSWSEVRFLETYSDVFLGRWNILLQCMDYLEDQCGWLVGWFLSLYNVKGSLDCRRCKSVNYNWQWCSNGLLNCAVKIRLLWFSWRNPGAPHLSDLCSVNSSSMQNIFKMPAYVLWLSRGYCIEKLLGVRGWDLRCCCLSDASWMCTGVS